MNMNEETRHEDSRGMVLTPMGEGWVAVPTGEASVVLRGFVRLNTTAKLVWEGIDEGLTEQELAQRLMERYEVDEAKAVQSVARVLGKLRAAKLVEE